MINQRWEKRILRAQQSKVVAATNNGDFTSEIIDNEEKPVHNHVKDNEKLMKYLQKDNVSGYPTNMDMLANSVNILQHMREAILDAEYVEPNDESDYYSVNFPFGGKIIKFKLSKVAVEKE